MIPVREVRAEACAGRNPARNGANGHRATQFEFPFMVFFPGPKALEAREAAQREGRAPLADPGKFYCEIFGCLSLEQVEADLGVGEATVRLHAAEGRLDAFSAGLGEERDYPRFLAKSVVDFINCRAGRVVVAQPALMFCELKGTMTPQEVGADLGVSEEQVRLLRLAKELAVYPAGTGAERACWRFVSKSVVDFINRRRAIYAAGKR